MSLCFQSALHQGEAGGGAAGSGCSAADLRGDAAGVAEPLRPRPLQVSAGPVAPPDPFTPAHQRVPYVVVKQEAVLSKKWIHNSTGMLLEFIEENIVYIIYNIAVF